MSTEELEGPSPGPVLKRAREAMGATQRDIADALHLPINTIDAIERGDKSRLPAHVFTQGYVRSYAKLLELDPDPLVTTLSFSNTERTHAPSEKTGPGVGLDKQQMLFAGSALGVIILIIVVVAFFGGEEPVTDVLEETPASVVVEPPNAVQAALQDNGGRGDDPQAQVASTDTSTTAARDTNPTTGSATPRTASNRPIVNGLDSTQATTESAGAAVDTSTPLASADTRRVRRLTVAGDDELVLEFTDDCWVEIKDQAGKTLFANLGAAGRELVFQGQGPFRVLLGYAPGARLIYNSEQVALTPHTRNNVANLVIGQ